MLKLDAGECFSLFALRHNGMQSAKETREQIRQRKRKKWCIMLELWRHGDQKRDGEEDPVKRKQEELQTKKQRTANVSCKFTVRLGTP